MYSWGMTEFDSTFEYCGPVALPNFTGLRVMMMPFLCGARESLPDMVRRYIPTVMQMCSFRPQHKSQVGYLTIDEKRLIPFESHRRQGLHVDGVFRGGPGGWGGGGWGSIGNGMVTASSIPGCIAFNQHFVGWPGEEGECEGLRSQAKEGTLFGAGEAYWLDGLCVHESLPAPQAMDRQFVRVSFPSAGPWFEGYTENPLGVLPTGDILPRREFM